VGGSTAAPNGGRLPLRPPTRKISNFARPSRGCAISSRDPSSSVRPIVQATLLLTAARQAPFGLPRSTIDIFATAAPHLCTEKNGPLVAIAPQTRAGRAITRQRAPQDKPRRSRSPRDCLNGPQTSRMSAKNCSVQSEADMPPSTHDWTRNGATAGYELTSEPRFRPLKPFPPRESSRRRVRLPRHRDRHGPQVVLR
jgi:hypothetical protein